MKKIILYGGAFNPPTVAHQQILQACADYAATIDAEVWIMPSGSRPDKSIAVAKGMRLKLVKALIASVVTSTPIAINTYELNIPGLIETYITHKHLATSFPEHEFIWVFGSDSISTMKEWGEGQVLWDQLNKLIIKRPGYPLDALPPRSSVLEVTTVQISSTLVREKIKSSESVESLVPATVFELLQSRSLSLS